MPTVLFLGVQTRERGTIARMLTARGHGVEAADTSSAAFAALQKKPPELVVVDLAGSQDALRLLKMLGSLPARPPVLAIADRRQPRATAEALRLGVLDVISRPVTEAQVAAAVSNAAEFRELAANAPGTEAAAAEPPVDGVYAASAHMREVLDLVRRIGPSRSPVLIAGERGSGRAAVARALHEASRSTDEGEGPGFVEIDCGLVSAEAFGRELDGLWPAAGSPAAAIPSSRSSFTTVFLRNIQALSPDLQAALERALVDERRAPTGRTPRLVAAAETSIGELAQRGRFRRELYERLSVMRIDIQPLRQRPQDVAPLALHFLKQAGRAHGVPPKTLSRSALVLLAALPWPGNATELRALMERLALIVPRGVVLLEDVLAHVRLDGAEARGSAHASLREAREQFERDFLTSALAHHHGRMGPAARQLGIERTNLYRKLKQLDIRWQP